MYVIGLIGNDDFFGAMKVQFAKPSNSLLCITAVETSDIKILVCLLVYLHIDQKSIDCSL